MKIEKIYSYKKAAMLLVAMVLVSVGVNAQSLYTNTSGGTVTAQNTAVNIASALTVGTGATPLTAATVSISGNFVSSEDVLNINGATSGTDGSISFSYNATSGVMTLTGSVTAAEYQATFRKITYTNTAASPNTGSRTVSFSLNAALPYEVNGHYYEYIVSNEISWNAAQSAAAGKTYFGLHGYLVTVTSSGESEFVSSKLNGATGWLGASDAVVEGAWRWVTGPETGTQFWSGAGASAGGVAVGGEFTNWNGDTEPNNSSDEDYAQFVVTTGKWNDLSGASSAAVNGYVVEYGDMSGDPEIHISDVSTVTISYAPLAPSGITGISTICNGFSSELTAIGAVGTVYWYTGSCGGTELGTGNPFTVSPTSTTTYYARNYNNSQYSDACASQTVNVNQPSFVPATRTVANLQADGANIKWYAASSGGSALATDTEISNGTTYYASQTVNNVESVARLAVTATIDPTPCAPTGAVTQVANTLADLVLTGSNIRWYAEPSGGTALPATTVISFGDTYYASQTVDCTESEMRLEVFIDNPGNQ